MTPAPREVCPRCRRPAAVCYCPHLVPLPSRTRVVILQHPREARVPIGTARMAHLMLANSELHRGVRFDDHPRVQALAADPAAALLFPDPGGLDPLGPAACAPRTLVVIDGTWQQARKVLRESPRLGALPRLRLRPARPGNYRIRREPAPECLATIEALAEVLGALEGEPERFSAMLGAFTFMVDQQIARASDRAAAPRRRRVALAAERLDACEQDLLRRAVLVHAEVNAHPPGAPIRAGGTGGPPPGRPEILHLVAHRLADGARFGAVLAPRRPLAEAAPRRLGLPAERLLGGERAAEALGRFAAFLRPVDVPCGWGSFTRDTLAAEAGALAAWLDRWLDLRLPVARRLQARPGTPEQAARALGAIGAAPPGADVPDRAGRTLAMLLPIVAALLTSRPRGGPGEAP